MTEKPEYVLSFQRPKNTEIKKIGNHWYLYECTSRYDPTIKRSRKISGPCLGKITEQGLVKTRRRLVPEDRISPAPVSDVVEAGSVIWLWRRTEDLRERLRRHFGASWRKIYAAALLRMLKGTRLRRLALHFEGSLLSHVFPRLSFTPDRCRDLLQTLGRKREVIRRFLLEDVRREDAFLLCDAQRFVVSPEGQSPEEPASGSGQRLLPQNRLMYVFRLGEDGIEPVYYRQRPANTPDMTAFSDLLEEPDIPFGSCTVLTDEEPAGSEGVFELLEEQGLRYIIPLRRGGREASLLLSPAAQSRTDLFACGRRAIQTRRIEADGISFVLCFDAQRYADELADFVLREEKKNRTTELRREAELARRKENRGRLTDEELAGLVPDNLQELLHGRPETGTVTLRTNRTELSSRQICGMHQRLEEIEQLLRTCGAPMELDAEYLQDPDSEEGWCFLHHLSARMVASCLRGIADAGEEDNVSLEDLRQALGRILACRQGDQWVIAPFGKSAGKLAEKLGFTVKPEDVEEILRQGRRRTRSA